MPKKNSRPMKATCIAHPVQGLVCAHGYKDPEEHTLPVETVFVSIGALQASVSFTYLTGADFRPVMRFGGREISDDWYNRMMVFVNRILKLLGVNGSYIIDIQQNFQSGIGIGSSGAVYAALTKSIVHAIGKQLPIRAISGLARLGSYSASAAIVGNVNVIRTADFPSDNVAEVIYPGKDFPYSLIILPVDGEKRSEDIHADIVSSPFYSVWLQRAQALSEEVISLILTGRIGEVGPKVEPYIYENYAAICTGSMNLLTWKSETLRRLELLRDLRTKLGIHFFISMNSGPAVFVYIKLEDQDFLLSYLAKSGIEYIVSHIGGPALLLQSSELHS
jgi:phosphomevalonate decarboxylase